MSEVSGNLTVKNETKEYGSNGFKKREVVITTNDGQYPQTILIEFIQDKCVLLDSYKVGDYVKIGYNLNGRTWVNPQGETKYFNSLQGWNISKVNGSIEPQPPFEPADNLNEEDHDDLPF